MIDFQELMRSSFAEETATDFADMMAARGGDKPDPSKANSQELKQVVEKILAQNLAKMDPTLVKGVTVGDQIDLMVKLENSEQLLEQSQKENEALRTE